MAAQVVYEGVNQTYVGTLFNGVKFWVSQRVPSRSSILAKIKDNGGEVVPLEKTADVLIADYVKKQYAPPDSVSWKYVEESVAKGERLDIEDFRIHSANAPRPAGSVWPTRSTRVQFTRLDEQILLTWVRRAGKHASGNGIYQKLEEQYPHHTWQSWRDKWVNKMSRLPPDQLPPLLEELPPSTARPATVAAEPASAGAGPPVKTAEPAATGAGPPPQVRSRVRFTAEDDRLLAAYVARCVREGKTKIFAKLAEEYPHHTAQSWQDRWRRYVSPTVTPAKDPPPSAKPSRAGSPVLGDDSPPVETAQLRAISAHPPPTVHSRSGEAPPASNSPRVATPRASTQGRSRLQELKAKSERIRATRLIQRVWRGYRERRQLAPLLQAPKALGAFQARAQGFLVRTALGIPWTAHEDAASDTASDTASDENPTDTELPTHDGPEPILGEHDAERTPIRAAGPPAARAEPLSPRREFWRFFGEHAQLLGVQPRPWAQVGRHAVDLWDLWLHATAQPHHASRDWDAVAEDLGLDWIQEPLVPAQLREAFERDLLAFEEWTREFEEEEDDEEEEEREEEEEDEPGAGSQVELEEFETAPQFPDVDFASSPPLIGLKRARESSLLSSSVRKRPRYDPSGEIPETPVARPERSGQTLASLRAAAASQETPSRRMRVSQVTVQVVSEARDAESTEDEANMTPSHQLLSEMEASPSASASGSWLPPVEDTSSDDSSDIFESMEPKTAPAIRRRTLLWATNSGGQPATTTPAPLASHVPTEHRRSLPCGPRDTGRQPATTTPIASTSNRPPLSLSASHTPTGHRRPLRWEPNDTGRQLTTASTPIPLPSHAPTGHRTLPWGSNNRGRQQATATPRVPSTSNQPPTLRRSSLTPVPRSTARTTRTAPPSSTTSTTTTKIPLDPSTLIAQLTAQGHPPPLVARAARVSTCDPATTAAVLARLVRGEGVPRDARGVWTEEDDAVLRRAGGLVETLLTARGRGRRVGGLEEEEEEEFWRLVRKHGAEGVVGRRGFLRVWDQL